MVSRYRETAFLFFVHREFETDSDEVAKHVFPKNLLKGSPARRSRIGVAPLRRVIAAIITWMLGNPPSGP